MWNSKSSEKSFGCFVSNCSFYDTTSHELLLQPNLSPDYVRLFIVFLFHLLWISRFLLDKYHVWFQVVVYIPLAMLYKIQLVDVSPLWNPADSDEDYRPYKVALIIVELARSQLKHYLSLLLCSCFICPKETAIWLEW